jgi:hypothetical protein
MLYEHRNLWLPTHCHQNAFSMDTQYYEQIRNSNFCILKGPNLLLIVKSKIFHYFLLKWSEHYIIKYRHGLVNFDSLL